LATRHKSAIKRHRQSVKRQERNTAIRTRVRHIIRETRATIGSNDVEAAEKQLREAVKALTKASSKGVLHRNNASRRISRLTKQVAALRAG
jgi:small subunit ribosomal protein S20